MEPRGGSDSSRETGRGTRAGVDFELSLQIEEDFTRQGGRGSAEQAQARAEAGLCGEGVPGRHEGGRGSRGGGRAQRALLAC